MAETYKITCDVESDWGGRSKEVTGSKEGLQKILSLFKLYQIKGLFFVSTDILPQLRDEIKQIHQEGHEIGSHGHFHIRYKDEFRWQKDKELSEELLKKYQSISKKPIRYRAPKFNREVCGELYSNRKSHVSLLKHMWFGEKINKETIIYLHPFDIVGGDNAPNLFCYLWYSNPSGALRTLHKLLERKDS